MVAVAQLVRASDCGPEGRRFDPGQPPTKKTHSFWNVFFYFIILKYIFGGILLDFLWVFVRWFLYSVGSRKPQILEYLGKYRI